MDYKTVQELLNALGIKYSERNIILIRIYTSRVISQTIRESIEELKKLNAKLIQNNNS